MTTSVWSLTSARFVDLVATELTKREIAIQFAMTHDRTETAPSIVVDVGDQCTAVPHFSRRPRT